MVLARVVVEFLETSMETWEDMKLRNLSCDCTAILESYRCKDCARFSSQFGRCSCRCKQWVGARFSCRCEQWVGSRFSCGCKQWVGSRFSRRCKQWVGTRSQCTKHSRCLGTETWLSGHFVASEKQFFLKPNWSKVNSSRWGEFKNAKICFFWGMCRFTPCKYICLCKYIYIYVYETFMCIYVYICV